ncbi:molybdopterin molybdotransferase MoeA [Mycetocola sp. 2940]|uniref:molybdopterin molybdotransferase MoeA n=1 Tax=Mycetocola sp. 2940 TaxID=3156452 RepID=UPI003393777E
MSGTSWAEARELSWRVGREATPAEVRLPLEDALGRIAAAPVPALVDLPTASVSAMDGWAVAGEPPWLLGEPVAMGSAPASEPLAPSTARPITTGAPVPPGTFGVLRSEHGDIQADVGRTWLRRGAGAGPSDPAANAHIRMRGEELAVGTEVIRAGAPLTPARIALAAASGHDSVLVRVPPRVSLLITGDELLSSGVPPAGSVRDALGPVLPELVRETGGVIVDRRTVADTRADTAEAIDAATGDLVVTTGGSSRGNTDFVRRVLVDSGGIVFDGVSMRPGHPVLLGRTRAGVPVLALPGNPLAALVCLVSFGIPLIRGMLGLPDQIAPLTEVGHLPQDVTDAVGRGSTVIVPFAREQGIPVVSGSRGPAMLRGLADADGLFVVEPAGPGYRVRILDLPWRAEG